MFEFRAADYKASQDGKTITGHAIVYSKPTIIGGQFIESIAPGAITETIANDDIRALYNHNNDYILGRNTSGTLKLTEDSVGLMCVLSLADTGISDFVAKAIERQDIAGWSMGFYVIEESWKDDGFSMPERTIVKMILTEVSICGDPAYLDTDISVRGVADPAAGTSNHMLRKAMQLNLLERIEHKRTHKR